MVTYDKCSISNFRSISVLPWFSKILLYNRLYDYLTVNNILLIKQFGLGAGHSTEHALLELIKGKFKFLWKIYELNLYQIPNITFQAKTLSIPEIFQNKFKVLEHNYSTRPSEYNFKKPKLLNLQFRHVDHLSGISILTNFWKQ